MFFDLPFEEKSLEILEWEIVELENSKISLDPPWVFILFQFLFCNFAVKVADDLVDQAGNIVCEEVDELVEDSGTSKVVNA